MQGTLAEPKENQIHPKCIRCDKQLDDINWGAKGFQPKDGLAFNTPGHWPSSILDSHMGRRFEICLCNDCITEVRPKEDYLSEYEVEPGPRMRPMTPEEIEAADKAELEMLQAIAKQLEQDT